MNGLCPRARHAATSLSPSAAASAKTLANLAVQASVAHLAEAEKYLGDFLMICFMHNCHVHPCLCAYYDCCLHVLSWRYDRFDDQNTNGESIRQIATSHKTLTVTS